METNIRETAKVEVDVEKFFFQTVFRQKNDVMYLQQLLVSKGVNMNCIKQMMLFLVCIYMHMFIEISWKMAMVVLSLLSLFLGSVTLFFGIHADR